MPTRQEQQNRRRTAKRRRRRLRVLFLWIIVLAVVAAAIVAVTALVKAKNGDQRISNSDTAVTTTTTDGVTPTAAPKTYKDGHFVQTGEVEWNLRLVNPWNPLPEDYDYEGHLVVYSGSKRFDARAIDALNRMIEAGKAYDLSAASLFRPYDQQVDLFRRQVAAMESRGYKGAEAEEQAATVVARPGTSEHHSGLAVDVLGSGYTSLEESFETTPAFAWLMEHCAEYGFILRFPKDKEDITGVTYEPWHYRYVGVEAATEIMARGITLEEYLEEQ